MNREEILGAIETLSHCQGFYGRLYRKLTDGSKENENFLSEMVGMKLKDTVDMVMAIEG